MFKWSQGVVGAVVDEGEAASQVEEGVAREACMSGTLVYKKSYLKNTALIQQGSVFDLPNKTFVFLS